MPLIKLNATQALTGALPAVSGANLTNVSAGKVVQKVHATTATNVNITANSTYTDTGLTGTITPTSSSNKILVIPALAFLQYQQSSSHRMNTNIRIVRGSTAIQTWGNDAGDLGDVGIGTYSYDGSAVSVANIWKTIYEDTPNTTSATTYKIQISNISNVVQFGAQHGSKMSTITLLEVES